MRYNKYIYWQESDSGTVLFNIFNCELIVLNPQIHTLLEQCKNKFEKLKEIHPTLFEVLVSKYFIVDNNYNEYVELLERWHNTECDPEQFTLILLPTLNCNMRCWYCYEKHDINRTMSSQVLDSIKALIKKKTDEPLLKRLNLNFFGGEPIICFNKICMPLLRFAKKECEKHNIDLSTHFTTNASLITDKTISALKELSCPVSMQITLDGNKANHDKIRSNKFGEGSFDKIIENIKKLTANDVYVNCRINYTKDNIDTVADIIDEFEGITKEQKLHLHFNMQRVWQDYDNRNLRREESKIAEWFKRDCLSITESSQLSSRHCYADYENNFIISYDGNIFKCTARDFTSDISEGYVKSTGEICLNQRYKKRMNLKRGNLCCKDCIIFPICHANCSQFTLEHEQTRNSNLCLFNYSEKEKTTKITDIINSIIKNYSI